MTGKIIKNCVPAIIALTLSGLYSIIDGLFIGYASSDVGLAAINIAWPVPALFTAVGLGIGTGGSILHSTALGRGKRQEEIPFLQVAVKTGFGTAICLGICLWCCLEQLLRWLGADGEVHTQAVQYCRIIILGGVFQVIGAGIVPILRNLGKPVLAMIAMICGMITNLVLNSIFIIGLNLGITGAALGTIAAQAVVLVIGMGSLKKAGIHLLGSKGQNKLAVRILQTGFPAFGISLAPTITLMLTNWLCMQLGGNAAVAAYAVVSYLVFPVQSLLQGVGDGLQPLMSFYYGAGEEEELKRLRRSAFFFLSVLSMLMLGASLLCSFYLGQWFGLSEQADALCEEGIRISAVIFLVHGYNRFLTASLNAAMKVRSATLMIGIECLVVSPVLLLGMTKVWGIQGIWWSLPATGICMLLVYQVIKKLER